MHERSICHWAMVAAAALIASSGFASSVLAQELEFDDQHERSDQDASSARQTRIYLGMWTSHLRNLKGGLERNSLIGVAYRGFFGATFINSYGDRGITAGIQRSLTAPRRRSLRTALGYRVGLVTGYDERLLGIASKVPAVPFVQLVGSIDHSSLGLELAYAGLVASIAVNWRP